MGIITMLLLAPPHQLLLLQVEDVEQRLLGCLLSQCGLMAELSALRNMYLLASPAAQVRVCLHGCLT
jgi:hypothetical protein